VMDAVSTYKSRSTSTRLHVAVPQKAVIVRRIFVWILYLSLTCSAFVLLSNLRRSNEVPMKIAMVKTGGTQKNFSKFHFIFSGFSFAEWITAWYKACTKPDS
jgi:hypothetical protein